MNKTKSKEIMSGQPVTYKYNEGYLISCCDCGLTHFVVFDHKKSGVTVIMYKDAYQTEKERSKQS